MSTGGRSSMGRARLSCLPCRKRKSKCDEKTPCSSCILRNTSNHCHPPDVTNVSPRTTRSDVNSPHSSSADHQPLYKKKQRRSSSATRHGAIDEFETIRNSLARLEQSLQTQHYQSTPSNWINQLALPVDINPLPHRLEQLEELLAILPCQSDCEILFEYLLQEADWIVNTIGVQWLQPIWSRFIYGARVTQAESVLLVSVLAVAALLLEEGPHIYYQTACPLAPLQNALIEYMFDYIRSICQASHDSPPNSRRNYRDILNDFFVLAMAFDYLRLSGARTPEYWPLVRKTLYYMVRQTPILAKSDPLWQCLDVVETEYARRLIWHFKVCERWGDLYETHSTSSPFLRKDIDIEDPQWTCSSLSAPFRAIRVMSNKEEAINLTVPPRNVPRIFRLKDDEEIKEVPLLAQLLTELSLHVSAASGYISAIESWRRDGSQTTSNRIDHQKEALLHQSVVICENIKKWQDRIESYCAEPATLDPHDYQACRKASQAAIIHVGRRQILSAILGAWVTEESITQVGSILLAQQQREAFKNARDVVKTIEVTKALLSCGKTLQIPWATLAFFNAATTLAIPLLAASKVGRGQVISASDYCPRVFRLDHLSDIDSMTSESRHHSTANSTDRRIDLASVPFYPSNDSLPAPFVLNLEEMRTLAPDILLVLELMPHYKPTFLSIEARQRLVKLVDTYGIGHSNPTLQGQISIDAEANRVNLNHNETSTLEVSAYSVLDSLIALDDFWWDQLLSSNDSDQAASST